MIRVIKRYESRKLYDTEESRYVSLEDIALWVREGQEVRVVDNATSADVSAQVLTQIILDEGKKGTSFLPTELLHELVRAGEQAFSNGVEQFQGKMNRIVQSSIDRLAPVRRAREEMGQLRDRLSQLERALDDLDANDAPGGAGATATETAKKTVSSSKTASAKTASAKKASAPKTAASKTAASKTAAGKTAARKTTARKSTATADKTAAKKAAPRPRKAAAATSPAATEGTAKA